MPVFCLDRVHHSTTASNKNYVLFDKACMSMAGRVIKGAEFDRYLDLFSVLPSSTPRPRCVNS